MLFKKKHVLSYFSFLLLTANTLAAGTDLACPGIETIKESANKLDEATLVNSAYLANTPPFAIHSNDIDWFAVVYNIHAASAKEALILATIAMESVTTQDNLFAKNLGGIYLCDYDQRKVELINNEYEDKLLSFGKR